MVRGLNTFERTIKGIKLLVNSKVKTRLGCLIYKQNQNSLEEIIRLAINLKTNEIIFSFMEGIGRLNKESNLLSTLNNKQAEEKLTVLKEKYKNEIKVSYSFTKDNRNSFCKTKCPALKKFVFIDNLGYISPCTWLVDKYPNYKSEINLKSNSLNKVLNCTNCRRFIKDFENIEHNICPVKKR